MSKRKGIGHKFIYDKQWDSVISGRFKGVEMSYM